MNGRVVTLLAVLSTAAIITSVALSARRSSVYGNYTAMLSRSGLEASGIDTGNVGGSGVWHLSITRRSLTFKPPNPYPATPYPLVSVTADRITLGPEAACSTTFGRTHKSIFKLVPTAAASAARTTSWSAGEARVNGLRPEAGAFVGR